MCSYFSKYVVKTLKKHFLHILVYKNIGEEDHNTMTVMPSI